MLPDGPCAGWLDFAQLALLVLNGMQSGLVAYIAKRQQRAERDRKLLLTEVRLAVARESRRQLDHGPQTYDGP